MSEITLKHPPPLHSNFPRRRLTLLTLFAACLTVTPFAQASSQLALDKGCYSCHGTPPKKSAPTFEQIATDYAQYRGQTDAAAKLAAKLREGHMFGGIHAHEQLTEESALTLVLWLIDAKK